ncbi:BMP family ABC transporter substrate-binding protein [Microbacterium sp. NPDC091313]
MVAALVAGCSAPEVPAPVTAASSAPSAQAPSPGPDDAARAAFIGGEEPAPEATIAPAPGSWQAAADAHGMSVTVLALAGDADGDAIALAATQWAEASGARVRIDRVADADALEAAAVDAAGAVDLVVGAGPRTVDVLSLTTAQLLEQPFLVIGAQLAEPTENVTAVIWPGAGFRGTGISSDGSSETGAITVDRAGVALAAGTAGVRWDLSGIVIQLP